MRTNQKGRGERGEGGKELANSKQPAAARFVSVLISLPAVCPSPFAVADWLFAVYGLLFYVAFWLFASPLPFPYNSQLARSAELSSGGFAPTFSFGRVIFGGAVDGVEFGGRSRAGNR
jgi:hypothetical protein